VLYLLQITFCTVLHYYQASKFKLLSLSTEICQATIWMAIPYVKFIRDHLFSGFGLILDGPFTFNMLISWHHMIDLPDLQIFCSFRLFSHESTNLIVLWNFRYDSDGYVCGKTINQPKNRATVIAISVVVPVMVAIVLLLAYYIWREKRRPNGTYILLYWYFVFIILCFCSTCDICITSLQWC
jgi:hypothetical protein